MEWQLVAFHIGEMQKRYVYKLYIFLFVAIDIFKICNGISRNRKLNNSEE